MFKKMFARLHFASGDFKKNALGTLKPSDLRRQVVGGPMQKNKLVIARDLTPVEDGRIHFILEEIPPSIRLMINLSRKSVT